MKRRNFLGLLSILILSSFTKLDNFKIEMSPLFYQTKNPVFLAYYMVEGKGVEPSIQYRTFTVQTYKTKTSFKNWIDIMGKNNFVVVFDYWILEAPTEPFDSAVYVRAALLNKSIPYIMTGFESRYNYTLNKKM